MAHHQQMVHLLLQLDLCCGMDSYLRNSPLSKEFDWVHGVLSPFLYCLFVDELLDTQTLSGLGVSIKGLYYCGVPIYANDLALIASSPEELQQMLDIVTQYASQWQYSLNRL